MLPVPHFGDAILHRLSSGGPKVQTGQKKGIRGTREHLSETTMGDPVPNDTLSPGCPQLVLHSGDAMLHILSGSSIKVHTDQRGGGILCSHSYEGCHRSTEQQVGTGLENVTCTDHTKMDTFLPYAYSHIIISLIFLLILLFLYILMFVLRSWLGPYSNAVKSTVVFYESKDPTEH